jgi:hypothetical protein
VNDNASGDANTATTPRLVTEANGLDWLPKMIDRITEHLGVPARIAVIDPVRLGEKHRRCWVWFPGNVNHNVCVDQHPRHWVVMSSNHRGCRVELTTSGPPTALQAENVLVLTGCLPGDQMAASEQLSDGTRALIEHRYVESAR